MKEITTASVRVSLALGLIIALTLSLSLDGRGQVMVVSAQDITLSPNSGSAGTTVTLKGKINEPDTPFSVHWNTRDGPILVEGKTGAPLPHPLAFSVTFTIPEDHYGRHSIYIVPLGAREAVSAPPFSITPSLFLDPKSATPGSQVTVTGKGFAQNDTAKVTFNGTTIKDNIPASSFGIFTTPVTIPEATAGPHILRASGNNTPAQDVPHLTIDIKPVVTVTPTTAEVGKPITLTGKGFGAERTITVKHNGNTITTDPSPLKTNSRGTFTTTFTLPMGTSLKPAITAADTAGNTATFDMTLILERVPPPTPVPLSPIGRVNWFGSSQVTFTWTEVTDPSGVVYTLELAKDLAFFPPYLKRFGLPEAKYAPKDKLPPGTYYWRVKALDGAGNESPWGIAHHPFKVGFFPFWSLILGSAIGGFIGLWLIIRLILGLYRWLKSLFYY